MSFGHTAELVHQQDYGITRDNWRRTSALKRVGYTRVGRQDFLRMCRGFYARYLTYVSVRLLLSSVYLYARQGVSLRN
jgi:hypothetical protein